MAVFYVLGCIIILCFNYNFILPAIQAIVVLAFSKTAVVGGLVGGGIRAAIQYGVARGLFSNESGIGSAPIAAAAAQSRNPVRQALIASTGTFWDTVVVCLMTGLVLVSTIMKQGIDISAIDNGGKLTSMAFGQIPTVGPILLTIGIITFAFSTVLGWAYYGERCVEYIGGRKVLVAYRCVYIAVAVIAPISALNTVWTVADILNALMSIPNLVAVLLLSGVIVKDTKRFINDLDGWDDTPIPVVDDNGITIKEHPDSMLMK
jgi:AGCS family alanine or glycine:cation symporter